MKGERDTFRSISLRLYLVCVSVPRPSSLWFFRLEYTGKGNVYFYLQEPDPCIKGRLALLVNPYSRVKVSYW